MSCLCCSIYLCYALLNSTYSHWMTWTYQDSPSVKICFRGFSPLVLFFCSHFGLISKWSSGKILHVHALLIGRMFVKGNNFCCFNQIWSQLYFHIRFHIKITSVQYSYELPDEFKLFFHHDFLLEIMQPKKICLGIEHVQLSKVFWQGHRATSKVM